MLLSIQVKPNSKVDHIEVDESGNLKVKIRAQPVDGKANQYLIEYIARFFNVSKTKVTLLKGSTNRYKRLEIVGNEVDLLQLIEALKI